MADVAPSREEVDPWAAPCLCGHPLGLHRLDWNDPEHGVTPDCDHCGCMEFLHASGCPWDYM